MYKLYIHAGSSNHGCEAIVRTTVNILDRPVTLFSREPELDKKYGIDSICDLKFDERFSIEKFSIPWIVASLQTKLFGKVDLSVKNQYRALIKNISKNDICFSIGGDNYCYPGTDVLAAINRNIKKKGAKTVLWGCSVEPGVIDKPDIAVDLRSFDLITARESISYEALKSVNPNVVKVTDPAFTLQAELLPLPDKWIEGNMVGINASPLVVQSGRNADLVYRAYKVLIEEILQDTTCGIALIPHVVSEENSDLAILSELYENYKGTNRIVLIEDHNCRQLKGYIARCRFFVGARTHATIAAYSACVPTLALGYSVKSKGIATDLFGTDEGFVLSVQRLNNPEELSQHFRWLVKNELEIRNKLEAIMPEYVAKAYLGKDAVDRLVR